MKKFARQEILKKFARQEILKKLARQEILKKLARQEILKKFALQEIFNLFLEIEFDPFISSTKRTCSLANLNLYLKSIIKNIH